MPAVFRSRIKLHVSKKGGLPVRRNGFFAMLSRMKHITRWGLMRNTMRESLSEHSFDTAMVAHALAVIGREEFGKDVDPGQIAAAALFHDASEILTGDMPTPVKYNNPDIKNAFHSVERAARQSLLSMLPPKLRPPYETLFSFDTEKPEFYAYVKAADKISGYTKCLEEQRSGNREFDEAARQLYEAICAMRLPEADYFLRQFVPPYGLTLDELQSEENQGGEDRDHE